jgi:hypothetical protein
MWAMFAAPLEIAADVRRMPDDSAAILKNPEVIAVNQDPLVKQARRAVNMQGFRFDCRAQRYEFGLICALSNLYFVLKVYKFGTSGLSTTPSQ